MNCDVCNYRLDGLGAVGRCPECGCSFDAAARLYIHAAGRWLSNLYLLELLALVVLVVLFVIGRCTLDMAAIGGALLLVAIFVTNTARWNLVRKIVVSPDGIRVLRQNLFRRGDVHEHDWGWDVIESVSLSPGSRKVVFRLKDGRETCLSGRGFVRAHRTAEQFVDDVHEAMVRG